QRGVQRVVKGGQLAHLRAHHAPAVEEEQHILVALLPVLAADELLAPRRRAPVDVPVGVAFDVWAEPLELVLTAGATTGAHRGVLLVAAGDERVLAELREVRIDPQLSRTLHPPLPPEQPEGRAVANGDRAEAVGP